MAEKTKAKGVKGAPRQVDRFCSMPPARERILPPDMDPRRAFFIRLISKKWANGTKLHYCFFDHEKHGSSPEWTGSEGDKQVVRDAFQEWKDLGIGLEFEEVDSLSEAEVRIAFRQGDGSWSYLGKDVLGIPVNSRTMNFGWSLTADWYGKETALHEIGHTLGAPHEHQNPKAGIDWDEDAVYKYFGGPPNSWSKQTTYHNVLKKLSLDEIEGSAWDPDSIMHYQFRAGLIDGPSPYDEKGIFPSPGLSERDKEWVKKFYPPLKEDDYAELVPFVSHPAKLGPGDQIDFVINPPESRKYTIQTFGEVDTVMVLFEKEGEEPRYLSGDDDSGTDYNAKIVYKLLQGRTYILRVRLYFASGSGNTAVMVW